VNDIGTAAGPGGPAAATNAGAPRARTALWVAALACLLLGAWSSRSLAEPATGHPGVDAVLVLDSSGSMRHTDPLRLRVPAAKLFISLLGPGDRVGVISFSGRAWPILGLTRVDTLSARRRLFAAVDKVSSRGAYTNLDAALEAGRRMLLAQARTGARRYLILMSDGHMDVGDRTRDAELTRHLLAQEIPELQHDHIQVFSIAFTAASDVALLKRIARATHGLFRLAAFDRDLDSTFTTLFERAKRPEMVPVKGGEFTTDPSIHEVTLVATKQDADVRIVLQAPGGKQWSAAHPRAGMRWFRSARFDMITVPDPQPGRWRILSSSGRDKAYIVTDLKLRTNVGEKDVTAGTPQPVSAWLTKGDTVVTQPQILHDTRFTLEIRRPDGVVARYTMPARGGGGAPGVFTTGLQYYEPGPYTLTITATAPTFQRRITRFFHVVAPPPAKPPAVAAQKPAPAPAPKPVTAPPPKPKPKPAPKPRPDVKPVPAAPTLSVWRVVAVFLLVNTVLFGLGGGGFWLWRRIGRGKSGAADAPAEEAQEEEKK